MVPAGLELVEVACPVDGALAEGELVEELADVESLDAALGEGVVDLDGVAGAVLDAVLGVGVDDVGREGADAPHGVVVLDHDEVGGVVVDADAGGVEAVEEVPEPLCGLGAGLDGEGDAVVGGVASELAADGELVPVGGRVMVFGDDADVGGDDGGLQVVGEVDDGLGLGDFPFVLVGELEAVSAEVAAECGDGEALVADEAEEVAPCLCGEPFDGHLAVDHIDLQAVGPDFAGLADALRDRKPE